MDRTAEHVLRERKPYYDPRTLFDRNEVPMSDTAPAERCCTRRGRPRVARTISGQGPLRCFAPQCKPVDEIKPVSLLPAEIEALRLVDLEGLQQEEAATVLGISRKTLWRDLHDARRKVTDALVNGRLIEMAACSRADDGECPRRSRGVCPHAADRICPYPDEPDLAAGGPDDPDLDR